MRTESGALCSRGPTMRLAGVVACGALLSCSATPQGLAREADALRNEAAASLAPGSRCAVRRLSTEPDLVGWEPGARARLVSLVD